MAKENAVMFKCENWTPYGGLTQYGGSVNIYT